MVKEELAVPVVEVLLDPQADLVEMALTVHPPRRLPSILNRRQQEPDQDRDDGDDDQQLDQRESRTNLRRLIGFAPPLFRERITNILEGNTMSRAIQEGSAWNRVICLASLDKPIVTVGLKEFG